METIQPAGAGDAIAGMPARFVARPESTAEAAAVVREAVARDLTIVARGSGSKQHWAMPPNRLDLVVDTSRLSGVVEHAAGDLIAIVRSGTPLHEVGEVLAPARQQLALDDPLPGATIGGTVAVSTSGPRRMLYGTVRDLLIGVTVVRADGAVAKAGGKVVKNVAGYDLGKLIAGSYGTLGLITECVFRLHPLPAACAYVWRDVETADEAARLAAAVIGAQVVPSALEIDAPSEAGFTVAALLEGVPAGVESRALAVEKLLGGTTSTADTPPAWWGRYPWGDGDVGLKLTSPLSQVHHLLKAARAPVSMRGSAGTGVFYAGLPGDTDPGLAANLVSDLRAEARAGGGHCVVLTAPVAIRDRIDVWGPVDGLALMRRVKEQFDPDGRLAPGRFVGGI
jgi:glycolate oxidase FAD binding subunit